MNTVDFEASSEEEQEFDYEQKVAKSKQEEKILVDSLYHHQKMNNRQDGRRERVEFSQVNQKDANDSISLTLNSESTARSFIEEEVQKHKTHSLKSKLALQKASDGLKAHKNQRQQKLQEKRMKNSSQKLKRTKQNPENYRLFSMEFNMSSGKKRYDDSQAPEDEELPSAKPPSATPSKKAELSIVSSPSDYSSGKWGGRNFKRTKSMSGQEILNKQKFKRCTFEKLPQQRKKRVKNIISLQESCKVAKAGDSPRRKVKGGEEQMTKVARRITERPSTKVS